MIFICVFALRLPLLLLLLLLFLNVVAVAVDAVDADAVVVCCCCGSLLIKLFFTFKYPRMVLNADKAEDDNCKLFFSFVCLF